MTQLIQIDRNSLALEGPVKIGPLVSPSQVLKRKNVSMSGVSMSSVSPAKRDETEGRSPALVAIDSRLEDYQMLVAGVKPGTEILVIDPHRDAVSQIARALSITPAESLQIICHGTPGTLHIGKTPLTGDNLSQYSYLLSKLEVKNILLYACDVAADENFIRRFHEITGANIAASAHRIGNAAKGGSWQLKERIGKITTASALLPEVQQAYPGVLISFSEPADTEVESRPFSISIADFNTDGSLDLAVTLDESNQISILLGNEEGSFEEPTSFDAPSDLPKYIATDDFNGDGSVDLAISNDTSDSISVLLGNGDGTFGEASNFDADTGSYGIVAADLDGDGNADLAVGNDGEEGSSGNVSVLLGNGDGTFNAATNFTAGDSPEKIAVGDFNGDDNLDIVTANSDSNDVSLLLGDGVGGFGDATNFGLGDEGEVANPYDIKTVDFNGDGILDVATSNYGLDTVSVLLGDGEGSFGDDTQFSVAASPFELVVADLDNDGDEDIATASNASDGVFVLLGDGAGDVNGEALIDGLNSPWAIAVEDFDDDSLLDLVVGSENNPTVSLLLNTTDEEPDVDTEPTDGDDNLLGTASPDRINALDGNDTIRGAAGNDILSGDDGNDRVVGNRGNDRLYGKDGDDVILGSFGNDRLFGGDGDDQLEGGIGRDRINGGAGNDTLVGGASIDRFIFNTNEAFDSDAIGIDTIEDFDLERDIVVLNRTTFAALESDAGTGFSTESEFAVVDTADAIETSEAFVVYNSADGGLYYNPNGSEEGLGDAGAQFAILTGTPDLQPENIFLNG